MSAPAVILVRPQLPENIGMAARAMLACGLSDLRLVRPRVEWPHPKAVAAATGAAGIVARARLFDRLEDAIGDLHRVVATTARVHGLVKAVLTPRAAIAELRRRVAEGERVGLLFGPERTGLESDEVALASELVTIPLSREFNSLNLSQAVLILAYEWFTAADATPARALPEGKGGPATQAELLNFFARLEAELDACGFLRHPGLRPVMVRNIRTLFERAGLTDQEVRTLHGVLTCLTRRPHEAPPPPSGPPPAPADTPAPPRPGPSR